MSFFFQKKWTESRNLDPPTNSNPILLLAYFRPIRAMGTPCNSLYLYFIVFSNVYNCVYSGIA
jgi:hypothetical protein